MPSKPFEISSQSKKKLRSFEFVEKIAWPEDNKVNHVAVPIQTETDTPSTVSWQDELPEAVSESGIPQTPAIKIPLADLVGNTEDAFNRAPTVTTPNDHVLWQQGPRSSDHYSSLPSVPRGSRKRARSSSPMPSQPEKPIRDAAEKEPLNLEGLQQSLRTPQNDPAADLWNRYAKANLSKNKQNEVLPDALRLVPSSPQTPSTSNCRDSSLRRTHSCGTEWPSSKSKRRRVNTMESHSRTKDIFAISKREILASEVPKTSRVSLLVEKIQESLARRPAAEADILSSSSPLPERSVLGVYRSPVSRIKARQEQRSSRQNPMPDRSEAQQPETMNRQHVNDGSSSEFGDEDLDFNLLESLERKITDGRNEHPRGIDCKPEALVLGCGSATTSHEDRHATTKQVQQSVSGDVGQAGGQNRDQASRSGGQVLSRIPEEEWKGARDGSEDEFDENDDSFAVEMQDLVAQYDSQNRAPKITQHGVPQDTLGQRSDTNDFDDDTFDDDDLWKEMEDETVFLNQAPGVGSTSQKSFDNRAIKRYLVLDIVESHYETANGRQRPEKVLSLKDEKTRMLKIVLLRQSWYDTRCTKGSYIHLIGDFDRAGQCIVDDADNMVILHPDHLISATVVADSFTCTRRAALQDRVKATGAAETSQVYGHILHEVFGEALKTNSWDLDQMRAIIEKILPSYIESLYEINVQILEAVEYLMSKMPDLRAWAAVFVSASPGPDAVAHDRNGALTSMAINKLLEVEEHIWSPMYGLKGNIDATVQVIMKPPGERSSLNLTVPLEFKTGKKDSNEMHRAQTALYTLLMSDRYDINVTCGVLYYLETSKTFRVESVRNEIRHMIIQRNELACYVRDKLDLPPMIKKDYMCKKCYAQTPCFIYHKLVEGGDGESSGMKETFDQAVEHLTPLHQEFFKKWDDLLTKEERDSMKFRRELWTMVSTEREGLGRCFANIVIEPGSSVENIEGPKINRYQYSFVKHKPSPGFSFTESQLTVGEPIVISDENGHFALANGFVTNVRPTRITVAVDRRLHNARSKAPGFDPVSNQDFVGIMDVTSEIVPLAATPAEPTLYRLDKDEFSNGMATARNNIIRMMEKNLFRARELRQLIIEGVAPSFKTPSTGYTLSGPASQQDLNIDQRKAIDKVMSARDYALVLGMPGTGKTTTIAHIIRALVSQNKSVLLTSYTHTAVDNILLKIKDDRIPILRLGAVGKVHPEVQTFADLGGIPKKTIAELASSYIDSKVVATTCLGINQPIFNARVFDYCIVDEASQITLPVCLGPIRMARTFILVGDHYQLPPLVQNKEAQEGGLDVSLFKILSDAQPDSVVSLEHQYRMAEDVMLLSNELIYSGRLKCGTTAVAKRLLAIPDLEAGLSAHHHTLHSIARTATPPSVCTSTAACWLRRALTPRSRCLFLNTDTIGPLARETVSGGSRITNAAEATCAAQLVTTLIRSGVSPRSIGVITFYRSQLALLRREIKGTAGTTASAEVEMHTADKFQGRDKEVVILSCVRSNEDHHVGDLLRDWRRVNVAVTRAKSKLLILGSQRTLGKSGNDVLDGLVKIVLRQGWVCDLPVHALEEHVFETAPPATTGATDTATVTTAATRARNADRHSPTKAARPGGHAAFRKPGKTVKGGSGVVSLDKFLDRRPVLRDILNELGG